MENKSELDPSDSFKFEPERIAVNKEPKYHTFDESVNMHYLYVGQAQQVERSVETDAVIDYDETGNIIGFEVFGVEEPVAKEEDFATIAEKVSHKWLLHIGFTEEDIKLGSLPINHSLCEWEGSNWVCENGDTGESNHALGTRVHEEIEIVLEMLEFTLDELSALGVQSRNRIIKS